MPRRKPARSSRRSDRLRDFRRHELGVGEAGERDPKDAVVQPPTSSAATWSARRVFPVPPGPVTVKSRVPFESSATSSSSSRSLPTSGLATMGRFVASSVRSGGKSPSPSWKRRSASTRSFSRCSPRSRRSMSLTQQPPRRRRENDLTTMCRSRDPRRAVDVHSHVALLGQLGLAGVDSHPNADRPVAERRAGRGPCCDRIRCPPEGDEESVALRVDLDAAVPFERFSQRGAVTGEELGVTGSMLEKQPRRAFDVGEEKRDGSGRQFGCGHACDDRTSVERAGSGVRDQLRSSSYCCSATSPARPIRSMSM